MLHKSIARVSSVRGDEFCHQITKFCMFCPFSLRNKSICRSDQALIKELITFTCIVLLVNNCIDCVVFNTIFNSISVITLRSEHLSMFFWEFFQPVICTMFFPSHWLLSHTFIVETKDSSDRRMNPVEKTIINPRKEYWLSQGSNHRPPVPYFKKARLTLYHTIPTFNDV